MENMAYKRIVQEYYSKRARDYDRQKIRTWGSPQGLGTEIINGVIDSFLGFRNKLVLEVGVGSGRIGYHLLDRVKPWFVGLDLSKEMLKLAKAKLSVLKQKFDLVLGDAEHLPFIDNVFEAVACISTMHYFADYTKSLREFSRVLKRNGVFVYGDLTLHELDAHGFLDTLEKTLSKAHAKYYKPSEMGKLLEDHGFHVSKMHTIPYRKSYMALMEDKGKYFNVKSETLCEIIKSADLNEQMLYAMNENELTLFYTLIITLKEDKSW